MNSRSSANERNLVKFSADLSTLNQLDTKDGLLSFPFDHIYACHSQSSDRRQPLHLAKEIEISTDLGAGEEDTSPEVTKLTEQLAIAENHNKKLKDLLIFHLDLIQHQNELITKKEKLYNALKQENDTLKTRLMHIQNQVESSPPRSLPTSTITSSIIKTEPGTSQIILNSFRELLPDKGSSLLSDPNRPMPEIFGIARTTLEPEVPSYKSADIKVPPALDKKLNSENFKMIDHKRSLVKKEVKTESRSEALYTVTSNSGNPIIQRIHKNRRRNSNIGSLSRMSKTPKAEIPETITSKSQINEPDQSFDRTYSINKKSKLINTYGKSRNTTTIPKRTTQFTGSLSDRLQLIDTTPTGEDPYQLGEADMREQSPIPKLMLQKTNHGRMKICSDPMGETTRRVYDMTDTKSKINRFMSVYEQPKKEEKTLIIQEPDLDLVKTETEISWPNIYNDKPNETSLCDFSYGEASMLPSLDANEFQELFTSDSALNLDNLNQLDDPPEKMVPVKTTKRGRTTSLMASEEDVVNSKRGIGSRRGRKRAYSTTGLGKPQTQKGTPRPKSVRGRGGAAARGKRSPVPGVMSKKSYHTLVGDPDISWYFGLDPDLKLEDLDPPSFSQASTVEVPRWREKQYTSCYTLEGTENLDDKVFEKRHQKLEAEERRQLRWHMRRVREQRHVEKLRQRQRRDSWCTSPVNPPPVYTLWNRPQQDVKFIEITEELPVLAFGEPLPQLPETCFVLPWVRTSKAQKRSKRSKTMH